MTGSKRDNGISAFILASDDLQTIALFGTVVASMARELSVAQPVA